MNKVILLLTMLSVYAVHAGDERTLLRAAANGNIHRVRDLLARGINANAHDDFNERPLYYAAIMGHIDVVRALLDHGAYPDQSYANSAEVHGHVEIAQYIRGYEDIPVTKGVMEDI